MERSRSHSLLLAAIIVAMEGTAGANGAFPDSLQILLPADRPQQIVLATNFGLIISEDEGLTWSWTCEQMETLGASLYGVGPPPMDRFFAVPLQRGLAYSDDSSCSWRNASASGTIVTTDFFPDPTNPLRVMAIAFSRGAVIGPPQLLSSDDAGASFGRVLFTASSDVVLQGVEIARSDPMTVYLAMYAYSMSTSHPRLARSTDGGENWTVLDAETGLGANRFRIIAVDPLDPNTVFLRVMESSGERLAVTRDGGVTYSTPIRIDQGRMTAFARLASGTILISGLNDGGAPVGFRSGDGGRTFQEWAGTPHLRAMAERSGKLYAAGDNYLDGWAIGVSIDEGATFEPVASYKDVSVVRSCAQAACGSSCEYQADLQVWPRETCGDAGATVTPVVAKGGCGCMVDDSDGRSREGRGRGFVGLGWMLVSALLLAVRSGRSARDGRASKRRRQLDHGTS